MDTASLISVQEAAERLGVGGAAVRQHIASGRLTAVKRGRSWWLDAGGVERMARQRPGRGRPLSPEMAWAVLLLASGDPEAAERVAGQDRYRSRGRAWLREHPLVGHASRLRDRAWVEGLDAHPGEIPRILRRSDVLPTGISVGRIIGVVGGPATAEVYAPAGRRAALMEEQGLESRPGSVRIRWVRDDLWPLLPRGDGHAPSAAVLIDLLEHDDPRVRREAARELAR